MGDAECDFFSSREWRERLRRHVSRTWDIEHALSHLSDDAVDRILAELVETTGIERSALHRHDLGEIIERDGKTVLGVDLDDAVERCRAVQDVDLPDRCPHPPEVGERCVFHADPESVSGDRVRNALFEAIGSTDPTTNQFVGLSAGTLDLSNRTVDAATERALDLRFSRIGTLDLSGADVAQDVLATGIVVNDPSFERTSFRGEADFSGGILGEGVEEAIGPGDPDDLAQTDNFSEFQGDVSFRRATFERKADFKRTRFGGDTSFNSVSFGDIAMFNFATVEGGIDLMHAVFGRKADFSKATIGGYAVMNATYTDNAMFNYTTFEGQTDFWNCTFEGMVDLWATEFEGAADFRYADFGDHTSIKEAHFEDGCDFSGAQFERKVVFDRVTASEPLELTESTVSKGRIVQPRSGYTCYDLTDATLGDVRLRRPDGETARLDRFRFLETDFDGFEFSRHREDLRGNWWIHTYVGDDHDPTSDQLEVTYLRAKNGATESGDSKAASEFFLREMRYRRKSNWRLAWHGDGLRERIRGGTWWLVSWFYNATCGYGERPLRTGLVSLGLVLAFAAVYWTSPLQLENSGPVAYLTFSLQTLVTLIYGGIPAVEPLYVRFLAAVEAFVGAFFIALFVFALTRSIHR